MYFFSAVAFRVIFGGPFSKACKFKCWVISLKREAGENISDIFLHTIQSNIYYFPILLSTFHFLIKYIDIVRLIWGVFI